MTDDNNNVKDVKVFIKLKHEKVYLDKKYVTKLDGTFNEIFDKVPETVIEEVKFKKERGK